MALLDDAKLAVRISQSSTAFDSEIEDLIDQARADMVLCGVTQEKADDDTDPLIKRAILVYCKANFGWNNPDAARLQSSYESIRNHLTLSPEYNGGADDAVE